MWRNQKYYTIFHWFPNHFWYIDHGNTKFSYIYTIEMQNSLWKNWRWNARLIYTINNNNNKKNNKNQVMIAKAFGKFLASETILSIISKIFLSAHLTILLPLTFSNFVNWNNLSILRSLRFLLPKAAASAFCCF